VCMRVWDVPNLSRGCEPHRQLWRSRRSAAAHGIVDRAGSTLPGDCSPSGGLCCGDLLLKMNLDFITISAHLFTCLPNLFGQMHVCLFGSCLFGYWTSLFFTNPSLAMARAWAPAYKS